MYYESCEKYICTVGGLLLNETAAFRQRLQELVGFFARSFRIKKCSLMLVNADDPTMEVMASTNPSIIGLRRKLSDVSISTMALLEGKPFLSDGKKRSYFCRLEKSEYSSEFSLSIPIVYLDKKLGVINFTDSEDGDCFSEDQENALSEIMRNTAPYLYAACTNELYKTNSRMIEAQNEQLRRLDELKTNLTSYIVHDLKGPISTLIANLDMLSYEPLTDQQVEYLGIAVEDAYKMQRMVLTILDVLKLEDSQVEIFRGETDICRLAERELASFRSVLSRKNIEAVLVGEPHISYVDEDLMGRTISNLLLNAIEYSPEGTKVTVSVRYDENRKELTITVSDQGRGIPDEFKEKVFDKFFQAGEGRSQRKTTTGLGLTFCKLVVTAHGGTIRVEDVESGGARFVITLPEALGI